MGYQFKLEALRRYRKHQEELQQKELADANKILNQIVQELENKISGRKKTEQDLKSQQAGNATAAMMSLYEQYLKKITEEIAMQRRKVVEAKKICEAKRNNLLLAMQKRKALERIKEKDLKKYVSMLEKKEAKFINEMAINRFAVTQK